MKQSVLHHDQIDTFSERLNEYRTVIDQRITTFITSFESETAEQFGELPLVVTGTFTDYLRRGGKRIRGALVMVGYELLGGKDTAMILDAALAIEMLQAYILMLDDIQDRSETRRGGPTAHLMLSDYHQKNYLRDDPLHFGESMAMNAFTIGCHAALSIVANLNAEPTRVLAAIKNINRCYIATGQGQTMDIFNEVIDSVDEDSVTNVLIWKTAYYTFVNPLQLGAILAGASDDDLQKIYDFSIPAGKAFQITDDILGIFGEEFESGKSPLDDIKEGKRTLLAIKALELAPTAHAYFLEQCLGKHDLSMSDFKKCRQIISECGALDYTRTVAQAAVLEAIEKLNTTPAHWNNESIEFLEGLVNFLLVRKA